MSVDTKNSFVFLSYNMISATPYEYDEKSTNLISTSDDFTVFILLVRNVMS